MSIPVVPFGNTGLRVTRLGLGLAALGRPGYINLGHGEDLAQHYVVEAMERRTHRLLDLAYQHGVRYFDAARSYGRAERFLHHWLEKQKIDPVEVVVGSKWGYTYTAGWQVDAEVHEVKEHTLPVLQRQWGESQVLLPYLKLYQIHSATFSSGVLTNEEVLDELARLKREEGIRIGLSLSGPDQTDVLAKAMTIRRDDRYLFDAVQATFNVLETSSGVALAAAAESGMGVVVKEALANGRLTVRNNNAAFRERKAVLQQLADRHQVGIDAIALAYVLAQPWAHVVLSGAATERHLLDNLKAFQVQLSDGERSMLAGLATEKEDYWQERSALQWN